jgi:hypothetical protein
MSSLAPARYPVAWGCAEAPPGEAQVGTRPVAGHGRLGRATARAAFWAERGLRPAADVPAGTSLIAVFSRLP